MLVNLDNRVKRRNYRNKKILKNSKITRRPTTKVLNKIEEVSIDLRKPYKNIIYELMLKIQVFADIFYVLKYVNTQLDNKPITLNIKNIFFIFILLIKNIWRSDRYNLDLF